MSKLQNLTFDSNKAHQPSKIKMELMEHQKTILYAMKYLEKNRMVTFKKNSQKYYNQRHYYYGRQPPQNTVTTTVKTNVGILSDRVGAGKTLMIISLISSKPKGTNGYISLNSTIDKSGYFPEVSTLTNEVKVKGNLIIVPFKLVPQWKDAIEKAAPHLNTIVYSTIKHVRTYTNISDIKNADIVLLGSTKAEQFNKNFDNVFWNRIFIDEADTIKIKTKCRYQSSFLWLVTATPDSLDTRGCSHIRKVFKGAPYQIVDALRVFNDKSFLEKSIILPPAKRILIKCFTPAGLTVIKTLVPQSILSMVNAGNTDQAIKALGCNIQGEASLVQAVTFQISKTLKDKQNQLALALVSKTKTKKDVQLKTRKIKMLRKLVMKYQLKLDTIKDKIQNMNDEMCPVCMDEFESPAIVNCCHSIFCFECILVTSGVASKCPECGEKLDKSGIKILDKEKKEKLKKKIRELKNKMDTLIELLQTRKDRKILLFANYNETFNKIMVVLTKYGITHSLLTGQASHVAKTLKEFENGKINVLMLNARFFGAGMNLQMATDVIMYHRFDKDLEEQVIGRAQRLGRKNKLNIFYLLHDNESHSFTDKTKEVDYDDWLENGDDEEDNDSSEDESADLVSTTSKKYGQEYDDLDTDDEDELSHDESDLEESDPESNYDSDESVEVKTNNKKTLKQIKQVKTKTKPKKVKSPKINKRSLLSVLEKKTYINEKQEDSEVFDFSEFI